jgi:hypothetical protein
LSGVRADALAAGTVGQLGQFGGARLDHLLELLRLGDVVDQLPFLRPLGAHALGGGAEDVGEVAPHPALVDQAGEAAGAGQHAEQRHFGQADRGGAVVDHGDLVAGQRHFVAAAGGGAVQRGEELQAGVFAGILEAVARLVGELAEVHLPGVGGQAEHVDVGAGAEHARLAAGDDDAFHLGVLEADALHGIVQFHVDAEVVGVELQLVAGLDAAVFLDVQGEGGHMWRLAVEGQSPVGVAGRIGVVGDHLCASIGLLPQPAQLCSKVQTKALSRNIVHILQLFLTCVNCFV